MALSLVTASVVEPVTLDETKSHLKEETDDENGLIVGLIVAAREYAETFTHRAIPPQTWDLALDSFAEGLYIAGGEVRLPLPPVSSVTSITYLDTAGVSQTWSASLYRTDLPTGPKAQRARITPAYAQLYPSTYGVTNAVTIRFVCGYATPADVPSSIKAAMLLLIGHWFSHRDAVNVGNIVTPLPLAIDALLWPYKAF